MIHLYEYQGPYQQFILIKSLFPPPKWGIMAVGLAGVALMLGLLFRRRLLENHWKLLTWGVPSLAFVGMYVFCLRYVDENFTNLVHPYNLWHHGRFSFSPASMVDGTVELLYFFLLTPFAFSHESLLIANIVAGGLLGWGHLLIFQKFFRQSSREFRLFAGVCFSLWLPLILIFADGFGAGLVSLIFFTALYCHLTNQRKTCLLLAALLPLVRIDAIAYSGAFFFADFVETRQFRWRHWLLSVISLVGVLGLFRVLYGHWIPTPVVFKKFTPGMIGMLQASDFLQIIDYFCTPLHFGSTVMIAAAVCCCRTGVIRRVMVLLIPLGFLFAFYTLTAWNPTYDGRYYFGWELCLLLLPFLLFDQFLRPPAAQAGPAPVAAGQDPWSPQFLLPLSSAFLIVASLWMCVDQRNGACYSSSPKWETRFTLRLQAFAVGGQTLAPLLPPDWTISATELDTFGFMLDRPVIDLWGYTNPKIASSSTFSPRRIHNAPVFIETRPDVHWYRSYKEGVATNIADLSVADLEEKLPIADNFSKECNQLGDPLWIVDNYDFVILKAREWTTFLLVRKDRTAQFQNILVGKYYRLKESREFDRNKLAKSS